VIALSGQVLDVGGGSDHSLAVHLQSLHGFIPWNTLQAAGLLWNGETELDVVLSAA
jgi:hypothetical protein